MLADIFWIAFFVLVIGGCAVIAIRAFAAMPEQNARKREADAAAAAARKAHIEHPKKGQEFVEYESKSAFEYDQGYRMAHGWRIVSISDVPQRAGVARYATLGIGALVIKPGSHVYVVWEHD